MACKFENNLNFTCADKQNAVGGFKPKIWIGNHIDLAAAISFSDTSVDISALSFTGSTGLHVTITDRDQLSASVSGSVNAAGVPLYTQTVIIKNFLETSTYRDAFEELALASRLFMVIEKNAGTFEIFGGQVGLRYTESTKDYGFTASEADTTNIATFTAEEQHLPRIFFDTSAAQTLTTLESYEV